MGNANDEAPVALVTGAARGIGRAISARLIGNGWQVALLDLDGDACVAASRALGDATLALRGDVASEDDVVTAVSAVRQRWGRLRALVNNAAHLGHGTPLAALERATWDRVLAVNLTGPMLLARHCAPLLREGDGVIVNIASTRAHQSEPDGEAYAASKGGLIALTHALAMSLGPAIRVNAVTPGWIDTRREDDHGRMPPEPTVADHLWHPCGRVGRPEDVAALVAWLVGPEAGFVTGAEWVLDGGVSRRMVYPPD